MEKYTMFMDWKNKYCQNGYTIYFKLAFIVSWSFGKGVDHCLQFSTVHSFLNLERCVQRGTAIRLQGQHQVSQDLRDPLKPRVPWALEGFPWTVGVKDVTGCVTVRCNSWSPSEISTCLSFLFSAICDNFYYQTIDEGETKEMLNSQLNHEQGNSDLTEAYFLIC